jgi:HAD superfamily hydrolase (TIGR01549 family)
MQSTASAIKPPVRGIIFDLDGTLYRMSWLFRPLLLFRLFPHSLRLPHFIAIRDGFAGREFGCSEALMEKVAAALAAREKSDTATMRRWIDGSFYPAFIWVMRFMRNSRSGIRDALADIKRRGIRPGLLSDYGRVRDRLRNLGIDASLFDTIASSEECGALKPSPLPLVHMARAWNIPAGEVLVVGDRSDTDGEAARRAGMQFLQVRGGRHAGGLSWEAVKARLVIL